MKFTVIIEKAGQNFSAWSPDLPGCITTGPTVEETIRNMHEAISGHLAVMREFGDPMPDPVRVVELSVESA